MSLEDDFKKAVNEHQDTITAKVKQARQLISEAITIAEEHGIPFYASVSSIRQPYVPHTFENKFPGLDSELVGDLTAVWNTEYPGWQNSAIC